MTQRIYVADDEKNIRTLIEAFLVQEGFEVQLFANGETLLEACKASLPDLVVLDIMLPGLDGLSVCAMLRKTYPLLSIIIVSTKDSPYDRVTGLTIGSDDYLVKPFLPMELVARVRALLRRSEAKVAVSVESETLCYGPLVLQVERRSATLDGLPLPLTPSEFDFLAYLIQNKARAVSREELLEVLWQMDWQVDTRATDDLVKRLRRKLRDRQSVVRIETVWGFGFRLQMEGEDV